MLESNEQTIIFLSIPVKYVIKYSFIFNFSECISDLALNVCFHTRKCLLREYEEQSRKPI